MIGMYGACRSLSMFQTVTFSGHVKICMGGCAGAGMGRCAGQGRTELGGRVMGLGDSNSCELGGRVVGLGDSNACRCHEPRAMMIWARASSIAHTGVVREQRRGMVA